MATFGHSKFLPIFWENFLEEIQNDHFLAKIRHSEFIHTFLVLKDWKKFGTAKMRHSEFIQTFLVLKEWKKFGKAKLVPKL